MMASQQELAVRRAIRDSLADVSPGSTVLVACSGGADSLALAAAAQFVGERAGIAVGGVTVDHGLQSGSADRARDVAAALVRLGLDPVEVIHVPGSRRLLGPEGNARAARYAALGAAAAQHGAAAVLLGHTRDDQAESVLLGLVRGSGGRSLAGMAAEAGVYRRPMLGLDRETVRAAVPEDVKPWEDPQNVDPAYARSRVRHRVLPVLEQELGPGIADALARTADLLRADADALDEWADRAYISTLLPPFDVDHGRIAVSERGNALSAHDQHRKVSLSVDVTRDLPRAVRTRVLRRAAIEAGCPATDLTAAHVYAVDALVSDWHGQRGVDLPGKVRAVRSGNALTFSGDHERKPGA